MSKSGFSPRVLDAYTNCGAHARVYQYVDDAGGVFCRGQYCHSRYCRPCATARANTIAANLAKKIENAPHLHIVLTLRHRDEPFADGRRRLYTHFRTLRSAKLWKRSCSGGAFFYQTHLGKDGLWHHHFHIIARGHWLNRFDLSELWHTITGDSTNVHVSKIEDGHAAVREVTRYAACPVDKDLVNDADKLSEMMVGLKGARLCDSFGTWRGFSLTKRPEEDLRPSEYVGMLVDIVARAETGERFAAEILNLLRRRKTPATGPPSEIEPLVSA